jgi:transcription antitermination factor NusG
VRGVQKYVGEEEKIIKQIEKVKRALRCDWKSWFDVIVPSSVNNERTSKVLMTYFLGPRRC